MQLSWVVLLRTPNFAQRTPAYRLHPSLLRLTEILSRQAKTDRQISSTLSPGVSRLSLFRVISTRAACSIQTRNYEDKNGNKRTAVEIVADRVSFCGSKTESNTGTTRYDSAPAPTFTNGAENAFSVLPDDDDTDYSFDGDMSDDGLPF